MRSSKFQLGRMNNAFNGQILAEKLSKLNNSQQSIESLSHWCIYHRKKAKQVVETWNKLFNSSQREQRVPFLYLANDILQNSRRKGSEFVHEFWKVLPGALKDVFENCDDHGKNVVTRLVNIWEERKVFGSRGKSLKDEMLGNDPPPLLENNGKSSQSQSIKIVRKDNHSIRLKLSVGSMPEKIITAFQPIADENFNEDDVLNNCKEAVHHVGKMEKDVEDACINGNQQDSPLANKLQEQETTLKQCIEKLGSVEATRAALVTQLKEALQEQESKLELVRTQVQVAQAHVLQATSMKQRLSSGVGPSPTTTTSPIETATAAELNPLPGQTVHTQPTPPQPVTSFANSKTTTDEDHKRAAAAVAAKLTASTSSAQVLSSILSSLAAEEAASMKGGLNASGFTTSFPVHPPDKRPKLEKPMPLSDMTNGYFAPIQQQQQLGSLPFPPVQVPAASMQPMSHNNQQQPPFAPPLPPLPPPPPPVQQYAQSGVSVGAGAMQYGYGGSSLPPPPPPLPNHMLMGLARPSTQPHQQPPSQPQQQNSAPPGFYQSQSIGFYGQSHPPPPPVSRP